MTPLPRVELQAEVARSREELFELVSTLAGLRRWLDDASPDPGAASAGASGGVHGDTLQLVVGSRSRLVLADAVAVASVLAVDQPQHISFSWDWEAEPLPLASVVAFDLVDHGARTHATLRHVGLRGREQVRLHESMWRHWFGRLLEAGRAPLSAPARAVG